MNYDNYAKLLLGPDLLKEIEVELASRRLVGTQLYLCLGVQKLAKEPGITARLSLAAFVRQSSHRWRSSRACSTVCPLEASFPNFASGTG